MGQVPPKYFLPSSPYGASPAANALNPTQPAAQNAQVPLLPPNFQDPGTMQSNLFSAGTQTQNPFGTQPRQAGGGWDTIQKIFKMATLLLLFLPVSARATTTVTGTLQNLGTGTVGQGAFVRFWLRGCGGNIPRVSGTAIIAPSQGGVYFFDFPANGSGVISGTLYSTRDAAGTGNGDIECGGSRLSVWYGMQVFVGGKGGAEVPIHAKNAATIDISNVTPITTNPVVPSPTGDSTYLRKDAGNSPLTGPLTSTSTISDAGGTHTGPETFTGALNCKNFETIACIDSANSQSWAGSDSGAQLNSAIASLGAAGGKVLIAAGTFSATTTVAIATNNVTIECLGSWRATGTQGASILRWTGGASPQFTVAARNFTMKSCSLDNTGSATYGIQLGTGVAAAGHVLIDDVAVIPSVQYATAGVAATNQAAANTWIVMRRCYVSAAAPVGIDIDHTNIFVSDNTSSLFNTQNFRFGNAARDFGVFITNGSDSELSAAQGNSAIGWNFLQVTTAVLRDSYAECGDTAVSGQLCVNVAAGAGAVVNLKITGNYFNGSSLGNYAIKVAGGTGVTATDNAFNNFVTAGINNTGVSAGYAFDNYALGITPSSLDSATGFGLIPSNDTEALGAVGARWAGVFSSAIVGGIVPSAAGAVDVGSAALPFGNLWLGTAATNNFKLQPGTTTGARIVTVTDPLSPTTVGLPFTIASGTSTLTSNAALAAVTSQAAITTAGTGILTTDTIEWSYASAPTAGDSLCHVSAYPTAGNVNFVRTNPTAAAQNVSAIVINWRVIR